LDSWFKLNNFLSATNLNHIRLWLTPDNHIFDSEPLSGLPLNHNWNREIRTGSDGLEICKTALSQYENKN